MSHRLALFDLDNTLIDRSSAFARWAADFAAGHGLDPLAVPLLLEADGDGFVPRAEFFARTRERFGLSEPASQLWAQYRATYPTYVDVASEVPAALDRLRAAGWRVAIVTNGTVESQSGKIRRTGLDAHVDAVVISEAEGVSKPDPRLFAVAAERVGAPLSADGWMVGDCPVRDIGGGRQAGLRTVWIRRGRRWPDGERGPDHIADTIPAAVEILLADR